MNFSKKSVIRHLSELVNHFHQAGVSGADLVWRFEPPRCVAVLDGREFPYTPVYELKPGVPFIDALPVQTDGEPTLLVTVELSERLVEACRTRGLSAVDLNGRLYLRVPGLLVDRVAHLENRFVYDLEPRNVFVGKSGALVRTLLTDRDRVWTQAEVQKRGDASSGLASRIFGHLVNQGFLEKLSPREYRLKDPQALVDAWCRADKFSDRASTFQYASFGSSPTALATELADWAKTFSLDFALTRWIAGWLRVPYTEPVVVSAYVSRLPTPAELSSLGLTPVNDGGTVVLHVPTDPGVFKETRTIRNLPLVSDAQIVVDLQNTGLRGPDQAKALRESQAFCRP